MSISTCIFDLWSEHRNIKIARMHKKARTNDKRIKKQPAINFRIESMWFQALALLTYYEIVFFCPVSHENWVPRNCFIRQSAVIGGEMSCQHWVRNLKQHRPILATPTWMSRGLRHRRVRERESWPYWSLLQLLVNIPIQYQIDEKD